MISIYFQGKPFNIPLIQVYGPTANAKEQQPPAQTASLFTSSKEKGEGRCDWLPFPEALSFSPVVSLTQNGSHLPRANPQEVEWN